MNPSTVSCAQLEQYLGEFLPSEAMALLMVHLERWWAGELLDLLERYAILIHCDHAWYHFDLVFRDDEELLACCRCRYISSAGDPEGPHQGYDPWYRRTSCHCGLSFTAISKSSPSTASRTLLHYCV